MKACWSYSVLVVLLALFSCSKDSPVTSEPTVRSYETVFDIQKTILEKDVSVTVGRTGTMKINVEEGKKYLLVFAYPHLDSIDLKHYRTVNGEIEGYEEYGLTAGFVASKSGEQVLNYTVSDDNVFPMGLLSNFNVKISLFEVQIKQELFGAYYLKKSSCDEQWIAEDGTLKKELYVDEDVSSIDESDLVFRLTADSCYRYSLEENGIDSGSREVMRYLCDPEPLFQEGNIHFIWRDGYNNAILKEDCMFAPYSGALPPQSWLD